MQVRGPLASMTTVILQLTIETRVRKVKCDEEWPSCRRCQSTGRICDGYGVWGGGDNSYAPPHDLATKDRVNESKCLSVCTQASLVKPLQVMSLTGSEQGCFEWYMCRSAVKLPGAFISASWTMLLCQASTTEPAIRHAVLALASAHREEVCGASSRASECNDEQALFTVRQYSKAITCLQPCFADNRRTSVRITLMTCALFVYMEFLRGHYTRGIAHLDQGLSLLQSTGGDVKSQDPSSAHIDGWIVTVFTRLLVQVKLLGQDLRSRSPCLPSSLQPTIDTFRSIHHARRTLEHIMLGTFNLKEQAHHLTTATTAKFGTVLRSCQTKILTKLDLWNTIHEATVSKLPPQSTVVDLLPQSVAQDIFAHRLLHLYYLVAKLLADSCLESSSELIFDRHNSDFLGIISHCIGTYQILYPNGKRDLRVRHDPEPSSPNSISDIGWIAPLYFTAIKCRNHRLRYQAVKLLQSTPHKEGIWNATLAVRVARQVMEIEEGNFYDDYVVKDEEFDKLAVPTEEDLAAAPSLPEEFRLDQIDIVLPDDRAGKLILKCFRRRRNAGVIECISKEYDLPSRQWRDIAAWTTTRSR